MQRPLIRISMLAKRWVWVVILGVVICGGSTYIVSKHTHPIYQASTILYVSLDSSNPNNVTASIAAIPTYAQLVTNSLVINSVLAKHNEMTLQQLTAMISVKPAPSSQLIELDIQNGNPQLAMQLANEISQSFAQYANSQLSGNVQILPAQLPTEPIKPKPLQDAGIGVLIGLGLALALIVIFEWIDNRFTGAEEVQEFLDLEVLSIIPYVQSNRKLKNAMKKSQIEENYSTLCANLNTAQIMNPFKLLMITSALTGEGKSKIAANIASFLAKTGKRVLLVDADLRRPSLSQYFQLDNHQGLSTIFMKMGSRSEMQIYDQQTEIPSLRVLTAGAVPPNPSELLQTPLAKQLFHNFHKAPFDYVIFDTPPLLPVADSQIIATLVDAVILVVDGNKSPRRMLLRAKQALIKTRTMILGIVINKCRWPDDKNFSSYYNYVRPEAAPIMSLHPEDAAPDLDTVITPTISSQSPLSASIPWTDRVNLGNIIPNRQQQTKDK